MDSGLAMMGLALWPHLTGPVVHHRNMWLSTTTTRAMTTRAEIRVEFTGRLAFDDEIADYVVL